MFVKILWAILVCVSVQVFGEEILNIPYVSQFGQDKWVIEEIFHGKKNGFFLDIGAADGRTISNTFILEKIYNWKGICIEANPLKYPKLISIRKNSINLNVCLDYTNHEVNFRDRNLCSGIVASDTDNKIPGGIMIKLFTKTLAQVLDECQAPSIIDFLSIDVEGAETRILKSFPFDRYTFLALAIERPSVELHEILLRNGYVFVRNQFCDSFYVHQSIDNLNEIPKNLWTQNRNF